MRFLIAVLTFFYSVMYHGERNRRSVSDTPKKEIFYIGENTYVVESLLVTYALTPRIRFVLPRKSYGMAMRLLLLREHQSIEIHKQDYPLLVPGILRNTYLAHILSRRQLMDDASKILDVLQNEE